LDSTRIFIHGDGADWIKKGLEWFPGSTFVLDKYHKNKYITKMTAGLERAFRKQYNEQIRYALVNRDERFLLELADSLASQLPDRKDIIRKAAGYLNNHIGGIAICSEEPEANNGGCTEPHVSHVLSSRLSSRPLAWSATTLKQLAPMLANGGEVELLRLRHPRQAERIIVKASRGARRAIKKIQFAPDPDSIGTLKPINTGKVNQLYRTLASMSQIKSF
jgi:hypothetical protein